MLRKLLLKWVFCGFIIMLQIYTLQAVDTQNQEATDKETPETVDWSGLLTDLRGSWQSPLSYLEKRGYLPAGNENLLEEKLNELRGMKSEGFGNIEDEASINSASANTMPEPDKLNQKAQVANEVPNPSVSSAAISEPRASSAAIPEPRTSSGAISEPRASNSAISEPRASSMAISEPRALNSAISEASVSNSAIAETGAANSAMSETSASNPAISETSAANSAIAETSVSNSAASLTPGSPTATFTANNNPVDFGGVIVKVDSSPQQQSDGSAPIVTYSSRQHLTDEEQEDLFKGLTIPINADVDKEIDLEPEEDLDSYKNDKGKASGSAKSKSKKKKCKSKSKSKSKTKGDKPGFFQRIKSSFTSMFKKSDKVEETKKTPEKQKFVLSPDFANYYVRYLAHRGDANPETNSLTVNDLQGQYTSVVRDYGDWETGGTGKGLYRRDFCGKDLTFKDFKSKDPLLSESNAEDVDTGKNDLESPELDKNAIEGTKDLTLREFPFKDFNFGNIDMKQQQTKDTRSEGTQDFSVKKLKMTDTKSEDTEDLKIPDFNFGNIDLKKLQTKSTEDLKATDLKKFDSKDEDLNKIVHSLTVEGDEPTAATKGLKEVKSDKFSTTKDDFTLQGLSAIKEAANNALQDGLKTLKNVKFANGNDFSPKALTSTKVKDMTVNDPLDDSDDIMQKDLEDLKKLTSALDDKGAVENAEKNVQSQPATDTKDELSTKKLGDLGDLADFTKSSFNTKDWDTNANDFAIKRINLKDFDFNQPDLGIKGLSSYTKASTSGTREFGDLGMPNSKLKALEASAQTYSSSYPTDNENNQINESTLPGGFSLRIRDFGVNDALTKENEYVRQELDEYNNKNGGIEEEEGGNGAEANHVAPKEAKFKDFDLSSLSTRSDDASLEMDRQFTRQVLEKVLHDYAQNNEHEKKE